jgi:hypothetical protein
MNGFLVLLCHGMDDLPIRLCAKEVDAMAYAEKVRPMPNKAIREVFNTDCSSPNCVKVVRFVDGKPVSVRIVKTFGE